jgi:hypothetical protein
LKHYLKLNKKLLKYDELNKAINKAIGKIKTKQYAKYFYYAYQKRGIQKLLSESNKL